METAYSEDTLISLDKFGPDSETIQAVDWNDALKAISRAKRRKGGKGEGLA